jgi:hypothetical protein
VKVSHLHSNRQRLTAHVDRGLEKSPPSKSTPVKSRLRLC